MADLSKISINGVAYNLKDTTARQAIANFTSFKTAIVASLPTTDIDDHTIYFVRNAGSSGDAYNEYMYINSAWERIGSTNIDLSDYLQEDDIADWAKAPTKPTYSAEEVGALPNTYTAPVTSVNGQTGDITVDTVSISNTLSSGTLIATINNTNIYAPAYDDADGVSY